ncbi:hypothetical protein [Rhizobium leguminosarum]|uniref:hypothetical protein n=1 Tax=Rhizobium leguminosarum TaxID=384 RepID=UPI003F9C0743
MDEQESQRIGIRVDPSWTFEFIDIDRIEAKSRIVPIDVHACPSAQEFGDLHLIVEDLEFALQCFTTAAQMGMPDQGDSVIKALIFSGVTAYARPFVTGVRVKLLPEMFTSIWSEEGAALHSFLIDVRNRHVSHSVNEFERCDAVGIIVTDAKFQRQGAASGVGVATLLTVGLTRSKLDQIHAHIPPIIDMLRSRIQELKLELHAEMKAQLDREGRWNMMPIARFPTLENIGKRRGR